MLSGGIERDQRHEMVIKNKNATIEYLNFSVDKPHKDYCETRLARKQNSNNWLSLSCHQFPLSNDVLGNTYLYVCLV